MPLAWNNAPRPGSIQHQISSSRLGEEIPQRATDLNSEGQEPLSVNKCRNVAARIREVGFCHPQEADKLNRAVQTSWKDDRPNRASPSPDGCTNNSPRDAFAPQTLGHNPVVTKTTDPNSGSALLQDPSELPKGKPTTKTTSHNPEGQEHPSLRECHHVVDRIREAGLRHRQGSNASATRKSFPPQPLELYSNILERSDLHSKKAHLREPRTRLSAYNTAELLLAFSVALKGQTKNVEEDKEARKMLQRNDGKTDSLSTQRIVRAGTPDKEATQADKRLSDFLEHKSFEQEERVQPKQRPAEVCKVEEARKNSSLSDGRTITSSTKQLILTKSPGEPDRRSPDILEARRPEQKLLTKTEQHQKEQGKAGEPRKFLF
jgi:hypothetical protein